MLPTERPEFVTITAASHPLKVSRDIVMVREGLSLAEMLREAQPDPILARHATIFIGGHRIKQKFWSRTYPKAGTHVEIRVLPSGGGGGGGGKNILRTVLMLAVVAASFLVPALAPGLMATVGATLGVSTAVASSLVAAGISVVGTLLVNALVPVKQPRMDISQDPSVFGIEAARNRLAPFQTVPQVLGRHRIAPHYGAAPYTEIVGSDQYLRLLFVWGVGPLQIDTNSLRIGETPLSQFDGVEIEHRQGFANDAPLTLYPDAVSENQLTILLVDVADGTGKTGSHTRTSSADADELSIDISFPGGLHRIEKKGETTTEWVKVKVEYRPVGGSTWTVPSSFTAKTFDSSWVNADGDGAIKFSGTQKAAIRHGMRWPVPRGQYEVRVECIATYSAAMYGGSNRTYWTSLRTFTDEDPIQSRAPVAKTAIRIKASDQLNGAIDEFNGIVTTLGKDWNGSSWVNNQPLTNPASLFRHILQGGANAVPLADSRIDLARLQDWHSFCATNGFTFSQVRSGGSVWEALADCAAAGRASPAEPDGKWGVVIDRSQNVAVSHITPRNSYEFSVEKTFLELPHGFRVAFPNENEDYRLDERRIYRDGYDDSTATKFESLEIAGVTDPDQIWKLGRYRLAQAIHQPERWSFKQDLEYITYQRGDRVKITHDVLLVGLHSGRIKSVILNESGLVTGLVLDETVTMEAGKGYGIAIRTLNGSVTSQVVTSAGDHTTITLSTPIAANIVRNNLFGFGLLGQESDDALIISIRPEKNFQAEITAVPYREEVYNADSGVIPPFDTKLTPLVQLTAPVIIGVTSGESALAYEPDGSIRTRIMIEFRRPDAIDHLPGFRVNARIRPAGTTEPWRTPVVDERTSHYIIIAGFEGTSWDIQIWFEVEGRLPGPVSTVYGHTVIGRTLPPSPVTGATVWADVKGVHIYWNEHPDADFSHVRIETTTGSSYVNPVTKGSTAGTTFFISANPGQTVHVWLTAFDTSGNPSTVVGPLSATPAKIVSDEITDASVINSKIAEAAISVRHFVATAKGRSLNPDPFLMEGSSVWSTSTGITFTTVVDGQSGRHVARSTTATSDLYSDGIVSQRVPYDPSKVYRFSVWVRRISGTGTFYGVIRCLDGNGTLITNTTGMTGFQSSGSNLYPISNVAPGTGWTFYEFRFGAGTGNVPPTGTKFITLGARLNFGSAGTMEMQDLRLEQVIETGMLVDEAVIASKIAANAVTQAKIVDGAIVEAKLADVAVTANKIAANAVTTAKVANAAIDAAKLAANAVGTSHISDLAVTANKVADASIATAKLADGAVIGQKLADNAVTSTKLVDNAVTATKIADASIGSTKVADGAIITQKLADAGITEGKIATNAITHSKIAANAVIAEKIAASAITADKIAASTITGDKIAANTITTGKLVITHPGKALNPDPLFQDSSLWGWSLKIIQETTTTGKVGTTALRMSAGGVWTTAVFGDSGRTLHRVPYDRGKKYRVSFWYRRVNNSGAATGLRCYAHFVGYDASGNVLSTASSGTGFSSRSGNMYIYGLLNDDAFTTDWQFHSVVFGDGTSNTLAPNVASISLGVQFFTDSVTGDLQFQDMRFEEAIEGSLIVDGAITASKIAASTITGDKLVANAITGDKIAANSISTRNLIVTNRGQSLTLDPKFQDSAYWSWGDPSHYTIVAVTDGKVGDKVMNLSKEWIGVYPGNSDQGGATHRIPYDHNKTYRIGVWARRKAGTDPNGRPTLHLRVHAYNSAGTLLTNEESATGWVGRSSNSYTWKSLSGEQLTTIWQYFEYIFGSGTGNTIEAGANFIGFAILPHANDTLGHMQIQDLRIEEAIESSLIVDGAISAAKLAAGSVTTAKLAAGAVTANEIAANTITAAKIATGTITATQLAAATITANELAANAVTAGKIAAGAVITAKIAAGAVTANEIAAGTITANELAANSIVSGKIAANTITANELAANAVTTAKLAAGAVTANELAANAVTAGKIEAGAVITNKIAASAVTANEIAANAVTTDKLAANAVDAGKIAANAITADKIAANVISAGHMVLTQRGKSLNPDPYFRDVSIWTVPAGITFETITTGKIAPTVARATSANQALYSHAKASQWVPYDSEKVYRFSGWVRRWNSGDGTFYGVMRFRDSAGTQLMYTASGANWQSGSSENHYNPSSWNPGIAWSYFEVIFGKGQTFKPGDDAVEMCVGALLHWGGTTGGMEVQGLRLEEAVDASLIVDGAVTASKVAAGAITADKIAANAITAEKISAGTITADRLVVGGVTTDRIADNAVTNSAVGDSSTSTALTTGATTLASPTLTLSAGSATFLMFSMEFDITGTPVHPTGTSTVVGLRIEVRVLRNSTPAVYGWTDIAGFSETKTSQTGGGPDGNTEIVTYSREGRRKGFFSFSIKDAGATAGSTTYHLQARIVNEANGSGGLTANILRRSLMVIETKK